MSVLAGTWCVRDVKDMEALIRKVADDRLRSWGARLTHHDYDDLLSFLFQQAVELDRRYDPKKDKKPNFGAYTARILTLRCADWFRLRFGDTRHGPRELPLSLDAPSSLTVADGDGEGLRDRLVDTLAAVGGDPADDLAPDLVGVLSGRRRRDADGEDGPQAHDTVGEPADRGAARGDRRPARHGAGTVKPRIPPMFSAPALETPVCEHCFQIFLNAFKRSNKQRPEQQRQTLEELAELARYRAQAVKVAGEWMCSRCTTIKVDGVDMALGQIYPNRAARRRAFGGNTSKASKHTRDGRTQAAA